MKITSLLAIAFCVVVGASVSSFEDDPTPPSIAPQFTSTWTLSWVSQNISMTGFIAIDYINSGGFANYSGIGGLPVYLETNLAAHPSKKENKTNLYWYDQNLCFDVGQGNVDNLLGNFSVPYNSTYVDTVELRGELCTVWLVNREFAVGENYTAYVGVKQNDLVRVEAQVQSEGAFTLDFYNTVVGPFDPIIYGKPDINCPKIPDLSIENFNPYRRRNMWKFFESIGARSVPQMDIIIPLDSPLEAPIPPNVTKRFLSNFIVTNQIQGAPNNTFEGVLGFDQEAGGLYINLTGLAFFPAYIRTQACLQPDPANGTDFFYWYQENVCWNLGHVSLHEIELFPLNIPHHAHFLGKAVIRNEAVTGWNWKQQFQGSEYNITMWVGVEKNDAVRVETNIEFFGIISWEFFDTVVGPVKPEIYAPPQGVPCIDPFNINEDYVPMYDPTPIGILTDLFMF